MGTQYSLTMAFILIGAILFSALWAVGLKNGIYKNTPRSGAPLYWSARIWSPVLLLIFIVKTFLLDFTLVPTSSMWPVVVPKNFVLSSKLNYNVWFQPFTKSALLSTGNPKRGDVINFVSPINENQNFLKRVIGLPGETVSYTKDKNITIFTASGEKIAFKKQLLTTTNYDGKEFSLFEENNSKKKYTISVIENYPFFVSSEIPVHSQSRFSSSCTLKLDELVCHLKAKEYFVMGDNRDQSLDSRYWGIVPHNQIVDKAVASCSWSYLSFIPMLMCKSL